MTEGQDRVEDDEQLYRRVPNLAPSVYSTEGGQLRFSSTAFNDRSKQPSVNRAKLQNFDPHRSRFTNMDGVIELNTAKIRAIGPIVQQNNSGSSSHVVNVVPDPIHGEFSLAIKANPAHALIVTQPPLTGPSAFKRFKESLAKIATDTGWCVEPGTSLPRGTFLDILHDAIRWMLGGFWRKK